MEPNWMISFIGAVYESSKEIPEHRNTELHFWLSTTHAVNQQIVVILSTRLVALKDSVKSIRCPKQAEVTFLVLAAQCNLKPCLNSNLNNNFLSEAEMVRLNEERLSEERLKVDDPKQKNLNEEEPA